MIIDNMLELPNDVIEYIIDLKNRAEHKENMSKVNDEFKKRCDKIEEYRVWHIPLDLDDEPLLILADTEEIDCFISEYYNPEYDIISAINCLNIEIVLFDKYDRFYSNTIPDEYDTYVYSYLF